CGRYMLISKKMIQLLPNVSGFISSSSEILIQKISLKLELELPDCLRLITMHKPILINKSSVEGSGTETAFFLRTWISLISIHALDVFISSTDESPKEKYAWA